MQPQLIPENAEEALLAADNTTSAAERTVLLRSVLTNATPYLAYQVAIRQYYVHEAEQIVCRDGSFATICQFASNVKSADLIQLGRAVAAMKEPAKAMSFMREFHPAEFQDLQYVVAIGAMEPKHSYLGVRFAMEVPGADVKLLQDAVQSSQSELHVYMFARDVKSADLRALEDAVERYCMTLAALWLAQDNIRGINMTRMERVVVQHGSTDECFQYASKVPFAPFQRLMLRGIEFALNETTAHDKDTSLALYRFAEKAHNVNNIGELYDALVDTRWDHIAQRIARNFVWPGKRHNVYQVQA